MNVENTEDLFLRELLRAYSIETELVDVLSTLQDDVDREALDSLRHGEPRETLQEIVTDHRTRTEEHVERLERALEALDQRAEARSTPVLDGIVTEKERFNNVVLNDEVRPVYYAGTAREIETLEVGLYERLRRLADHLDFPEEVTEALEANLQEDRETVAALESFTEDDSVSELIDAAGESGELQ